MIAAEGLTPLAVFDESFFDAYESELGAMNVGEVAQATLGSILTLQAEEGQARTYADIKAETEAFFANPIVAQNMQLLDAAANLYAQFCMSHPHGTEQLNDGLLGDIFQRGLGSAEAEHSHANHRHHEGVEASDVRDPKGKSSKKRKSTSSPKAGVAPISKEKTSGIQSWSTWNRLGSLLSSRIQILQPKLKR